MTPFLLQKLVHEDDDEVALKVQILQGASCSTYILFIPHYVFS